MKRTTALVAAAMGLALGGCSSGASTARSTATTGPTYTSAQAVSSLVIGSDVPADYKNDPTYQHDAIPGGCGAIDAVLAKDTQLAPHYAVSSFRNSDTASSVDHEIALYSSAKVAADQYDAIVAALKACPSWTFSVGGDSATLSLTPGRTGVVGDRSAVLDLKVDTPQDKVRGQEVLVVSGNALVSLAESGPAGFSTDPRIDLLRLTTKLVQRLRAQAG